MVHQVFLDGCIGFCHSVCRFRTGSHDRSFRWTMGIEFFKQVAGSFQGNVLLGVQVDHLRLDLRPVLNWLAHFPRKCSMRLFLTARTLLDLRATLRDLDLHLRQIIHLPFLMANRFAPFQPVTAQGTGLHPMHFDMVWFRHCLSVSPGCPIRLPLFRLRRFRRLRGAGGL